MTKKVLFNKTVFPAVKNVEKYDHMLLTDHFVLTVNINVRCT